MPEFRKLGLTELTDTHTDPYMERDIKIIVSNTILIESKEHNHT